MFDGPLINFGPDTAFQRVFGSLRKPGGGGPKVLWTAPVSGKGFVGGAWRLPFGLAGTGVRRVRGAVRTAPGPAGA